MMTIFLKLLVGKKQTKQNKNQQQQQQQQQQNQREAMRIKRQYSKFLLKTSFKDEGPSCQS